MEWNGNAIPNAVVQTYTNGQVKMNKNDGTTAYNPSKDLVVGNRYVKGANNLAINTDAQIIMQNTSLSAPKGIYDLELGQASLKINDSKDVMPGKYSADVIWNLVEAP